MSDPAVFIENVSKSFFLNKNPNIFSKVKNLKNDLQQKKILALDKVSFSVDKGEVLAIVGMNGSGKTTLLRIIGGIYQPDSGIVKVNGKLAPLLHIGTGFQGELAAKDNIVMSGMLLGLTKNEIENKIDDIIEFAELERFSEMKLKHYSSGMRLRLAFSTAMQIDPDIILMDEALAVGDKPFKEKSFESFVSFKERGKTLLISTHNFEKILDFADRVLMLHHGKIVKIGDPKETIEQYKKLTDQQGQKKL